MMDVLCAFSCSSGSGVHSKTIHVTDGEQLFSFGITNKRQASSAALSDILMKVFWLPTQPKSTLHFLTYSKKKGRVKERYSIFLCSVYYLLAICFVELAKTDAQCLCF